MPNASLEMPAFALPPAMETLLTDTTALQFHVQEIRVNGYSVIQDALPSSLIEAMRVRFDPILEAHRNAFPTNRGTNRYQMYLPFEPPFSSSLLIEHPVALAIMKRLLGESFLLNYFASDTPFPGADYQAVHADGEALFPGENIPLPPYAIVLNVALVDVTEENGPMEVWPGGTHNLPLPKDIGEMMKVMVSQRLTMKAGDILLRDPRVWHRGTPHHGIRSRPNIALLYARPWFRFGLDLPTIRRSQLDALSAKAQAMLRYATVLEG